MLPRAMQLRGAYIVCVFVHQALYRTCPTTAPACVYHRRSTQLPKGWISYAFTTIAAAARTD
jgi:hypothetical protein